MKRIYTIILAVAMLAGTAAVADLFYLHMNDGTDDTGDPDGTAVNATETVTVDGITYELDTATNTATVKQLTDTTLTSVTIPETVQSESGATYTVTTIGGAAFRDCTNLTNVVMPDTVTGIGVYAFRNCTSLTDITLSDTLWLIGVSAFEGCTNLSLQSLPMSLKVLANTSFLNCTKLNLTTLPPLLKQISERTFEGCTSLALTELPAGVTSIKDGAFGGCTSLALTELPPNLANIGQGAFGGCTFATSLTIPATCTVISANAFDAGVTVSYTLTEGVTLSWEAGAFGDGVPFATYALSQALTVGDDVYQYLTPTFHAAPAFALSGPASEGLIIGTDGKLSGTLTKSGDLIITTTGTGGDKTSTVNYTITVKEGEPFKYTYDEASKTATLVGVSSEVTGDITVPETVEYQGVTYKVTSFADGLFSGRTDITGVTAPSVTAIPNDTFNGCTGLTFINIPLATSIGDRAFYECTALKTVNLLSSVGSVGNQAFYKCTSLTIVSLPVATTVGASAFESCTALKAVRLPFVINLGQAAFKSCQSLTEVGMPLVQNIGNYTFAYCVYLSIISLPEVTVIGDYAFRECQDLTELNLSTVEVIGDSAFSGCVGITTINLPKVTDIGRLAFSTCTSLSSISLPLIQNIRDHAFDDCTSLTTISLGSNNVTFGSSIVSDNMTVAILMPLTTASGTWLDDTLPFSPFVVYTTGTNIVLGFDMSDLVLTSYGSGAFAQEYSLGGDAAEGLTIGTDGKISGVISKAGELTISETVTGADGSVTLTWTVKIEQCVLDNVIYLPDLDKDTAVAIGCTDDATDITIPYLITYAGHTLVVVSIREEAFSQQHLVTVVIGDNESAITAIPGSAFLSCIDLVSITLPDSVTSIGNSAFYGCTSLVNISLPKVTSIGENAFYECTSLTSVDLASAISIEAGVFNVCTSLASVDMPMVTSIGNSAFYGCTSLASVSMPAVTTIGESAFEGCTSLALTELPSGLGYLEPYTFADCVNLRLTSLPDGVTTVGSYAFQNCTSLALTSLNNVATIEDNAFNGCTGLNAAFDLSTVRSIGEGAFANTSGITFKVPLTGIEIGENALGTGYYAWNEDITVNKDVSISIRNKTADTTYTVSGTGAEGLTVNKDGTISGKPQIVGMFTVTAKAKNTSVATFVVTGEKILPFVLSADTLYCITGKTVPASDDDKVTIESAVPSGYTVTWSVIDKSGCGITVVDGVIKGTAGVTGTYTITIVRTITGYGITQEDTAELTVVIVDVLKITSTAKDIVPA